MTNIAKKVVIGIALLLLINQTAFADDKFGQSKGYNKSQKSTSHPTHRPKLRFQIREKPYKKSRSHPLGHRSDYKPDHRRDRYKPDHRRDNYRSDHRHYYRPGYRTHYLPYGHRRVFFKNMEYFFFDGYFYRPYRNEYRIVDGPIGAIVLSLPRLHFSLQWNGIGYFLAGNTYYRRHPGGYIVVRNPGFRDRWR